MKFLPALLLFCISSLQSLAQGDDFEGIVVYETKVTSKLPQVSDAAWKRYMVLGDSMKVYFRRGFHRHSYPMADEYYNPTDQKIYIWLKGVDTLFTLDYGMDSSEVLHVWKYDAVTFINKIKCNKLSVETEKATITYLYAPAMHINPSYDAHNTVGRFDAYIQEAQSVYLQSDYNGSSYNYTQTAVRIEPKTLEDSTFNMPDLPIRTYSFASVGTLPEYKGGAESYMRFMQKHLNGNLGNTYITIPPGMKEATAVVKLRFVIDETGKIVDVEVLNRKEVHPALAAEAIRVTGKMPSWKPATLLGKKVPFSYHSSVTFMVSR